jgi:hypothetical protein
MTALGGEEVEATFSMVHSLEAGLLSSAAAQPHQAACQDGADLAEVGWEVGVDGRGWIDRHPLSLRTASPIRIIQIRFDSTLGGCVDRT